MLFPIRIVQLKGYLNMLNESVAGCQGLGYLYGLIRSNIK